MINFGLTAHKNVVGFGRNTAILPSNPAKNVYHGIF